MSLMMKGRSSLARARARLSSNDAVGATNSNSERTSQKLRASLSAVLVTLSSSSPVTITTAWLRGSSAQAYPIQIAASTMPGCRDAGATWA